MTVATELFAPREIFSPRPVVPLHKIDADQKGIVFMSVPGHVGIRRNEAADRAAKEAFDQKKKKKSTVDLMPFSDLNR